MENRWPEPPPARPADPSEIERMTGCVRWMYERGQAVVLWERTGQISLTPDSLPAGDVVVLKSEVRLAR